VRVVLFAAALSALLVVPLTVNASRSGPPPAHTGGFGEMSCHQCHWDNPLNDAAGQIAVEGIPEAYAPGQSYPITVRILRPDVSIAGFQIAAREDIMAMNAGADAGTLHATDELAETVQNEAKRVTYLQHTRAGAKVRTPGTAEWTFEWTAPEQGRVVFHVAGNASNGDDSPLGDYIYTAEIRTTAQ
jgi:hypothetical protein